MANYMHIFLNAPDTTIISNLQSHNSVLPVSYVIVTIFLKNLEEMFSRYSMSSDLLQFQTFF